MPFFHVSCHVSGKKIFNCRKLWSIGPGRKMDGLGQDYPDTPGPGRRFPAQSEGVIVQKTKKFYGWKILRKNILSARKAPHPPITGKIFYTFISCFMPFFWKKKYLIAKSYSFSLIETGASSFMKPNALGHWASWTLWWLIEIEKWNYSFYSKKCNQHLSRRGGSNIFCC